MCAQPELDFVLLIGHMENNFLGLSVLGKC